MDLHQQLRSRSADEAGNGRELARTGAAQFPVLLLDRHQSAAVLGVSCRTFESLVNEPWMPRPVKLGPRLLRWSLAELHDAIGKMPRQLEKQEPVRERIERLKGGR